LPLVILAFCLVPVPFSSTPFFCVFLHFAPPHRIMLQRLQRGEPEENTLQGHSDEEIHGYESFHRMSPLEPLRRQIVSLHRWRSFVRGTTAWAGALIAACWILAGLFVLDVVFELDVPQRLVVMAIGAVGAAWAWRRYSWPLLRQRESLTQVALLVERQHGIRSDLVAALQFESPAAARGVRDSSKRP
jgi:hypothetical protein